MHFKVEKGRNPYFQQLNKESLESQKLFLRKIIVNSLNCQLRRFLLFLCFRSDQCFEFIWNEKYENYFLFFFCVFFEFSLDFLFDVSVERDSFIATSSSFTLTTLKPSMKGLISWKTSFSCWMLDESSDKRTVTGSKE